jgi:hypothetical protein
MLDRLQSQDLAAPWKDGDDVVVVTEAAITMIRRGAFATPRCPISTMFTHWHDIFSTTGPMRTMRCKNAICARYAISIPIAGRR